MMQAQSFNSWLQQLTSDALAARQRCLVLLEGDSDWVMTLLNTVLAKVTLDEQALKLSKDVTHVFGDQLPIAASITMKNYRQFLGSEMQYLVFADSTINIDAFAALSGTVKAGGVLFFINTLQVKQRNDSFFAKRFINRLLADEQVNIIRQHQASKLVSNTFIHSNTYGNFANKDLSPCITAEQFAAVNAVKKVLTGHRNRPLVLTADRGRGKSSALAIACSQLMCESKQHLDIIISAPHQRALSVFFSQLKTCLPEAAHSANQCVFNNHRLRFLPIDKIVASCPETRLLLIDEAAAIPVYILEKLLTHYHRVAFASTQHGYEGAGRGFTLKFKKILENKYPQWRALHIKEPVRWSENDPLERLVFDTCLLNAELPSIDGVNDTFEPNQLEFCQYSANELVDNEALLSSIFAVLVTAHYQTSPSDLKMILENNNVELVTLELQQQVVAVALLMHEGQCAKEDILAIKNNVRRLKDQFLPQSLLTHCGVKTAFEYSYVRVMRIAVVSQYQGSGIGRFFLSKIKAHAQTQYIDFLGTSFGLNEGLLSFWLAQQYKLARVGVTQDKASGEYSGMLLQGLTSKSKKQLEDIQFQFARAFDYQLAENHSGLSAQIVLQILSNTSPNHLGDLAEFDQQTVQDFANKERQYANCIFSLRNWLLNQLSVNKVEEDVLPLISKILQKWSNDALCKVYGFSGQKEINQYLISYVSDKLPVIPKRN